MIGGSVANSDDLDLDLDFNDVPLHRGRAPGMEGVIHHGFDRTPSLNDRKYHEFSIQIEL